MGDWLRGGWILAAVALLASTTWATALDEYVKTPDDVYRYTLERTASGPEGAGYVLRMVSQRWRSEDEVDRPVWEHWVHIAVPRVVASDKALLIIDGGRNNGGVPAVDDTAVRLAAQSRSVVARVQMVPNQPLRFAGEDRERWEDAIIAYSWDRWLETADPQWPVQLAMVKSAVRAMDAVQEFVGALTGVVGIEGFVVTGASKRGWTTWLTGAVDDRVVAIAPLVIDMLNTRESFKHHRKVYGFYAPAVHDYEEMGIFEWIDTPKSAELMEVVDPFSYRDRLTMPKLMINASGDQFFLPDSSRFYYHALEEPKWLRYVPNVGHGLKDSDFDQTLLMFYMAVIYGWEIPQYEFAYLEDGGMRVITQERPKAVRLWQATNPKVRDFRIDELGAVWSSRQVEMDEQGVYRARVDAPEKGFTAWFMELTYDSPGPYPYKFTTGIRVTPDYLLYGRK